MNLNGTLWVHQYFYVGKDVINSISMSKRYYVLKRGDHFYIDAELNAKIPAIYPSHQPFQSPPPAP
jgi:hypothetical protein